MDGGAGFICLNASITSAPDGFCLFTFLGVDHHFRCDPSTAFTTPKESSLGEGRISLDATEDTIAGDVVLFLDVFLIHVYRQESYFTQMGHTRIDRAHGRKKGRIRDLGMEIWDQYKNQKEVFHSSILSYLGDGGREVKKGVLRRLT